VKAWRVSELGEPRDVPRLVNAAEPEPGPGHVVVRVLDAAANFPDVLMCRGEYQVRPELPFTPGVELSAGSRVRAGVELVSPLPGPNGAQAAGRVTVEIEGSPKPACVAESLSLLVP
jgi:NADPH:quinone reductase